MKKLLLSAAILSLSVSAFAEYQFDVSYEALGGLVPTNVIADIGFTAGDTFYEGAAITGPDGFPLAYQIVLQHDAAISFAPINTLELFLSCEDDSPATSSVYVMTPNEAWYFAGPVNMVDAPTDFGMFDMLDFCGQVDAEEMVTSFALNNAYPNPFNPTTAISFDVAATGPVSLTVFNIAGQEVANLVDAQMSQGSHSVTFDAAQLGSGVYLYTLKAGNFTETKKMVLVK